jgi:hypothetical protein
MAVTHPPCSIPSPAQLPGLAGHGREASQGLVKKRGNHVTNIDAGSSLRPEAGAEPLGAAQASRNMASAMTLNGGHELVCPNATAIRWGLGERIRLQQQAPRSTHADPG